MLSEEEKDCINLINEFIKWAKSFNDPKLKRNGDWILLDEESIKDKELGIKNYYCTKVVNFECLKNYFFGNLYKQNQFGPKGFPDGDDSELAKAILFLFYKAKTKGSEFDKFSLKIDLESHYTTIQYDGVDLRGDTINTFGTLFGGSREEYKLCEWSLNVQVNDNIEQKMKRPEYLDTDELDNRIYDFHKNFQTIGNFMMMPSDVNCYRGLTYSGWGDYFDRFLLALIKCQKNIGDFDPKNLPEMINSEKDKPYFAMGFDKFIEINALDDYCKNDKIIDLSLVNDKEKLEGRAYRWWEANENNKEYFREFAQYYIEEAEKIIKKRSEVIINTVLREYGKLGTSDLS